MIKLSYIVPVYNCENYISQCIDSLYNQNLNTNEFEVIIINDGSTDNSEEIILKYTKLHNNIIYKKQKNQGLSVTRNIGMSIAKGEYIQFVDSDDYLEPLTAKYLLKVAIDNQLDIITFKSNNVSEESSAGSNSSSEYNSSIVQSESEQYGGGSNQLNINNIQSGIVYIEKYEYPNYAWLYIFKREYIKKINLEFIPKIYCEDSLFTMELFLNANRMCHVDIIVYNYRYNPTSIMHNKDDAHQIKMINSYNFIIHYIDKIIIKYKNLMTEECLNRCLNRQNAFTFFLFLRLLRSNQSIEFAKKIITELEIDRFYPCKRLDRNEYSGIHWNILLNIINQKYLFLTACKIHKFIYGK